MLFVVDELYRNLWHSSIKNTSFSLAYIFSNLLSYINARSDCFEHGTIFREELYDYRSQRHLLVTFITISKNSVSSFYSFRNKWTVCLNLLFLFVYEIFNFGISKSFNGHFVQRNEFDRFVIVCELLQTSNCVFFFIKLA